MPGVLYGFEMVAAVSEFVSRAAHPRLWPFVSQYTGYRIEGAAPGTHAGLPSRSLTFIVAFEDPLDIEHGSSQVRDTYWAMVGGLHRAPAFVHHNGRQIGIQLEVAPRGAMALFGVSAAALANDVVQLDQVISSRTPELVERLSTAQSWPARWVVLDETLLGWLRDDYAPRSEVESMWSLLDESHGCRSIDQIAVDLGWSRRHLSKHFTSTFGLTPKTMARVMRFERAQRLLRLPTRPSLASVAHACGYADQAHMTRDWREFAGSPPTEWMTDETIPILQDSVSPSPPH